MKKIIPLIQIVPLIAIIAFAIAAFVVSCKKSTSDDATVPTYTCTACKITPDAAAANDAASKGIYKGVVIGSTGTIKFDVNNAGTTVTAVMIIDGVTVNLTSTVTWTAGVAYTAPFTGTLNGSAVTINFTVGASGGTPTVTSSTIPGHANAVFNLAKETSSALIEAYEGTYSTTKPESGTFNILLSRKLAAYGAISRIDGTTTYSNSNGTIVNNNLVDSQNGTIGTLSGDMITGKFTDGNKNTVTITGKRTL